MKKELENACCLLPFRRTLTVKSKFMTLFFAVVMILISTNPAGAQQLRWRVDLTVTSVDAGVQGISAGDHFFAEFEVDPSLFELPDGVQGGRFVNFDLTIGDVNWNESQPHTSPQFLLSSNGIEAFSVILTDTLPAHPDLSFSHTESPAAWEVKDENYPGLGLPIFGGDFGGTYTVEPVSDCGGAFDIDKDRDVDGLDLAGFLTAVTDLEGFAAVFGSRDYCPRPEPECIHPDNGWLVLKNDTPDATQLYIANVAYAWGETIPDTFLPEDFPALVDGSGASIVDNLAEFSPDTYYVRELPAGRYSILVTRHAVRELENGTSVDYMRVVYLNSDVTIVSCEQVAQLDIDTSSYDAYDLEFSGDVEEVPYDQFKLLLDSGRLTLANKRMQSAQIAASERIYSENIDFVEGRLEDINPDFLTFLRQPVIDDDMNDPAGDNWRHTITHNSGETSVVTTLGKKYIYEAIAENLKVKGSIDNERNAYLTLYNGLQAIVPPEDWSDVTMELRLLSPAEALDTTDVNDIEIEKQKIINSWHWIESLIVPELVTTEPADKPDCGNEIGAPHFFGLGPGATDQYGPKDPYASDGVFKNYFFPLKWYATCVKNQKTRGSCVAFGITGAVETSWAVKTNRWVNLSEQWLYYKAKNNWWPSICGDGLSSFLTAKAMKPLTVGGLTVYGFLYPYEQEWIYNASINRINFMDLVYIYSCDDYYGPYRVADPCSDTTHQGQQVCSLPFCGYYADKPGDSGLTNKGSVEIWGFGADVGLTLAKVFLSTKIPLVLSYSVTPSYDAARASGFLVAPLQSLEQSYGGHASLVTGYIDNEDITTDMDVSEVEKLLNGGGYFIVRNSWGADWKDAGYIYIPYSWAEAHAHSLITVTAEEKP